LKIGYEQVFILQQRNFFLELIFAVDFKIDDNVEIERLMELMLRGNC